MRTSTPTRVRTPVRSSSIGARPSPMAASPHRPLSAAAPMRTQSPRAAIATSPMTRTSAAVGGPRGASPSSRAGAPPPPMTTASLRNPSPGGIGANGSRIVSPASRTVSPLKSAPPQPYANASPTARGPPSSVRNGIVVSPRTSMGMRAGNNTMANHSTALVESPSASRGARRSSLSGLVQSEAPSRYASPNHARETSSMQKAQLKRETDQMQARVDALMAAPKPHALVTQNYFRLDLTREDDLRTAHLDRIMVDPENCGSKRVIRRTTALVSHMGGIMQPNAPPNGVNGALQSYRAGSASNTPRSRSAETGEAPIRGRTHYALAHRSSELVVGTRKAAADEVHASARRETESARRLRATSASDNAPWLKGPLTNTPTTQRAHAASPSQRSSRAQSPIAFDSNAPLTPYRSSRGASASHRHHDVFADKADGRGITVVTPRAARTKTAETIRREVAASPKPELPPRKKPAIRQSPNSRAVNDIFAAPYGDAKACDVRYGSSKRIAPKVASTCDPNAMNERSYDSSPLKGRRHVSPTVGSIGAAGVLTADHARSRSPDGTKRRSYPLRNASNITNGDGGMLSTQREASSSPARRHMPVRSSTAVNAPFGTDINEWAGASRHDRPSSGCSLNASSNHLNRASGAPAGSPVRYASPADRARGCRSPGFYSNPTTSMKSVFSWDS